MLFQPSHDRPSLYIRLQRLSPVSLALCIRVRLGDAGATEHPGFQKPSLVLPPYRQWTSLFFPRVIDRIHSFSIGLHRFCFEAMWYIPRYERTREVGITCGGFVFAAEVTNIYGAFPLLEATTVLWNRNCISPRQQPRPHTRRKCEHK